MESTVAILVFDDVEVLDACGPFEVFATARSREGAPLFRVVMVAERAAPIRTVGGMIIQPHHTLDSCPKPSILVVPGGNGRRRECNNAALVEWIGTAAAEAELVMSICTGVFLLARAGLLAGLPVTTHHTAVDQLAHQHPDIIVRRGVRFVDTGRIITAAGISAGIDASLHAVARLHGRAIAAAAAHEMEYPMAE